MSIDMLLFWMHCALWMTFRLIRCVNYAEVYSGHTTVKFVRKLRTIFGLIGLLSFVLTRLDWGKARNRVRVEIYL